jgi:type I restriction enzyme, S subunit
MMTSVPANWKLIPLDDCGEWGSGGTPKRTIARYYQGGTIPWVIIGDLNDGVVINAATYITDEGLQNSSAKLLPVDTLLIAMYGSIGKLGITGFECATNQAIAFCKPDKNIILKYLFYSLMNVRNDLITYGQGGAQQNISQTILRAYKIPLAPLNEQKRVADKLDNLMERMDACREHLNRVPEILKRFRQAVLAAAMSGKLTEEWRESKEISLHSWVNKNGKEVFPFITSGSRGWAAYYSEEGPKFLRVGNLDHDTIELDLGEIQHVNPPKNAEGKRTRIEVGDILISITADVGMVALIREDIGEAFINQHICLARQSGEYSPVFLAYFLASPFGLKQFINSQRGMTKQGLTLGDIKSLTIKIPTISEQEEIVHRVETLFALADRLESRYQAASQLVDDLKPALLVKAFRGKLVPQDPNDEPASILLDRIQVEKANQAEQPKLIIKRQAPREVKMTEDSVKEVIRKLPQDSFSFDELREKLAGDYDEIKDILFKLLADSNPSIKQVFDKTSQAVRFIRSGQ